MAMMACWLLAVSCHPEEVETIEMPQETGGLKPLPFDSIYMHFPPNAWLTMCRDDGSDGGESFDVLHDGGLLQVQSEWTMDHELDGTSVEFPQDNMFRIARFADDPYPIDLYFLPDWSTTMIDGVAQGDYQGWSGGGMDSATGTIRTYWLNLGSEHAPSSACY